VISILIAWLGFGLIAGLGAAIYAEDHQLLSPEAGLAMGILVTLFFPLVVVGGIIYAIYRGVPFICRGFVELYRHFFPKNTLPKARVVK
jgi:hypothetical protein